MQFSPSPYTRLLLEDTKTLTQMMMMEMCLLLLSAAADTHCFSEMRLKKEAENEIFKLFSLFATLFFFLRVLFFQMLYKFSRTGLGTVRTGPGPARIMILEPQLGTKSIGPGQSTLAPVFGYKHKNSC